jgi:hypothetical protein
MALHLVFFVCCVGSSVCDELITRSEFSFLYVCACVCLCLCVCVCVCVCVCACVCVCIINCTQSHVVEKLLKSTPFVFLKLHHSTIIDEDKRNYLNVAFNLTVNMNT